MFLHTCNSWGTARFSLLPGIHCDQHAIAFDRNGTLYAGNDGGIFASPAASRGEQWLNLNSNLGIGQFYPGVSYNAATPDRLLGGTQDNGTLYFDAATWRRTDAGDGGFTAIDPVAPLNTWYDSFIFLCLAKTLNGGTPWSATSGPIWAEAVTGMLLRPNSCFVQGALFIAPFAMDPADRLTLLAGADRPYLTRNGAASWTDIHGTTFPIFPAPGPATPFEAVSATTICPGGSGLFFVGTNLGRVFTTSNGFSTSPTWSQVSSGLPTEWVTRIVCTSDATVYATVGGGQLAAPPSHVFRKSATATSWTAIQGDLPNTSVMTLAVDSRTTPPALYAATDLGVYLSGDSGGTWLRLGKGLPNVPVVDVLLDPGRNLIYAPTHGRGVWRIALAPPAAPINAIATVSRTTATVNWTAPADNGGSPITKYTVTPFVGPVAQASIDLPGSPPATSVTIGNLTAGVTYTFKLKAANAVGTGPNSEASNAVTASSVPGPPTDVRAEAGNTSAVVSWTAPPDNGSPITKYTVTSFVGTTAQTSVDVIGSPPLPRATVSGLTNGTSYTFKVVATNAVGPGPASAASNAVTPAAVPGAPTSVRAVAANASAMVSWTAPADNGGSPITKYTVTPFKGSSAQQPTDVSGSPPPTSATIGNLTNGTTYTFTVKATNAAGTGPASAPSNAVTPLTVPGAPADVMAEAGNASATVRWTAPADDGGSPIRSYSVTSSPDSRTATVAAPTTTARVTGLRNGTPYTFTVTATNAAGTGPASAPSNSVTPATIPGRPTNVNAVAGNRSATVSWIAPTDNGGSPITSFTVTSSPDAKTATVAAPATTARVTGLKNGTTYTFTVKATNTIGDSADSEASNTVTPAPTVPGAPSNVSAVARNASATVSWTAPDDGGSPIASYAVTSSPGEIKATAPGSDTSVVVRGLTNGTAYTFVVKATNAVGDGPASAPSSAVTPAPTAPGPPTGVTAEGGNALATVKWTAPANDGGSAITGYTVTSSPDGKTATVTAPTTTAQITGLRNGTSYTFTVAATNAIGIGPASEPSNAVTPATVPAAPRNVSAVAGNASATVIWTAPDDGGSRITGYTVTSSPGEKSATAGGSATSVLVTGLTNGTTYTFTVTAANALGTGPASSPSNPVTPAPPPPPPPPTLPPTGPTGGAFHAVPPTRVLDTRVGTGDVPAVRLGAGATLDVQITGRAGIPSSGVSAIVLNATITGTPGDGFLTLYPTGSPRPFASNLNWVAGDTVANLVEVGLGDGDRVTVFVSSAAHVVFDVAGYVATPAASLGPDGLFVPVTPTRLLDTRTGTGIDGIGPLTSGGQLSFQVTGRGGVPPSGVASVVLNLTATNPSRASFVAAWPDGTQRQLTSNLNFVAGQTVPNRVIVPVGANGKVNLFNAEGSVDLVADVGGYYTDSTVGGKGSRFVSLVPTRILDTRARAIGTPVTLGPNESMDLVIAGQSGLPVTGVTAVVINLTVTNGTTASFLTAHPSDDAILPLASDLNWVAGRTVANLVVVKLSPDGRIALFNAAGRVDVIVDILGFYT